MCASAKRRPSSIGPPPPTTRARLRACFAELRVERSLYALVHEKDLSTDLSDEEWAYLKIRLPASRSPGRLRAHSLRDILDAIFYVLRSGCPWRFLPSDFPPWSTVYYHFRKFRMSGLWHRIFLVLRAAERKRVGKAPDASAAVVDSQSVKTTEEGAGSNGYDAHKNVKGRKRHLLVDTLGLLLSRSTSPPPTCRIGQERVCCSPASSLWCPT